MQLVYNPRALKNIDLMIADKIEKKDRYVRNYRAERDS